MPLTKKNTVTEYEIKIDEKLRKDYLENYTRRFGELKNEEITEEKDVIKGKIESTDPEGNIIPEGISADDTSLGIDIVKDKKIKELFTGKKVGETIDFDIKKAFPNDSEVAGILRIKKEDAEGVEGNFRFTINEISRFYPAELNQELFDKVYGEGTANSEKEFMAKLEEEIAANLKKESDYKLNIDIKDLALEKTEMQFPEEFLKRWLLKVNENTTADQIEQEFDSFRKDLKWQLIRNKVAKDNEVKISEEELLEEAKNVTRYQFQQYGLYYATDEQITSYANESLKREDDAKRIADKILEDKVLILIKDMVSQKPKQVTVEEFNKLFE